jgi:Fructose-2,6-bisphosphatase
VDGVQIEGTTETDRLEKWGEKWRELDLGIEKTEAVIKRGQLFCDELIKNHPDKNILIVSHGMFISHFLRKAVPDLEMKDGLKNTSISTIVKGEKGWECDLYNCTRHL